MARPPFPVHVIPPHTMVETNGDYTIPCAIMALATFIKPATLAPFT